MILYGHPFSSYTQKALIALYEHGVAFDYRVIGPDDPAPGQELAALWARRCWRPASSLSIWT